MPRIPGYDVEALLGRGGMGVVYKARHRRLNRLVALKMLLAGAYAGPPERARFQREAEAVASLHHANIVAVYDVGDHEGCPYFTMELLEGGSLAQALAGTPQPARQAAALLITLAEAVQVAHQAGIVHRDLKPANILLTAEGTPKVADFGLARHFEGEPALTLSGARIGTPSYMAPEQVIGKAGTIGPAADIYALGALLYEMLTGRPPFRGETAAETERQVIHDEPVSPSRLNPKVPRDLETICLKCLSKEPERRYASAAALADDLRRFGEGRPIQARPVGWGERSWRWCRRNPTAAALLVTALALVGLASGGGVWLVQQRAELRNEVVTTVAQAVSLRQGFHFREARQLLEQVAAAGGTGGAGRPAPAGGPGQGRPDPGTAPGRCADPGGQARGHGRGIRPGRGRAAVCVGVRGCGVGSRRRRQRGCCGGVRASAVRAEIVAALDDWASLTPDLRRREWLLAVARGADPDEVRDRLRQPELWRDAARLHACRHGAEGGRVVSAVGDRPGPGFAQERWRGDRAAHRHAESLPAGLLGDLRIGVGAQPGAAVGRGPRLLPCGPGAAAQFQCSLQRPGRDPALHGPSRRGDRPPGASSPARPRNMLAHYNLAFAHYSKGRLDGAIEHWQQALSIAPKSAALHNNLGMALRDRGRLDEAIEHLRAKRQHQPQVCRTANSISASRCTRRAGWTRPSATCSNPSASTPITPWPTVIWPFFFARGRMAEAIDHLQQAVRFEGEKPTEIRRRLVVYRYEAACANIQVAAGQSSEVARRGEPERAGKRRQALDWLRANLELTARLRNDGEVLGWSLATWLSDPALASVRDAAALAKLPDAEREPWQRLWTDMAASIAADPLEQGRERAARRQWDRAVDGYARNLTRGPTDDGHFWFEYAAVSLLSGDRPAYARTCARMIERCGKAGGPRSYHVARACTLAPDAVADASLPGRLAEKELKDSAREFWSLTEQGALAYRAGRFQQAVPFFEQSLQADPRPGRAVLNWLWLALAKQRLGKAEEARRWLNKAQAWLDQYRDGMPARAEVEFGLHLHNWLEAHVLRREAEALIPPVPPRDGTENRERARTAGNEIRLNPGCSGTVTG